MATGDYQEWGGEQAQYNLRTRDIVIAGEINADSAADLNKGIISLLRSTREAITIHWDSPGGDIGFALGMYSIIKNCSVPVKMICWAEICSAAVPVFQAADTRLLAPDALLMVHWASIGVEGDRETVVRWTKVIETLEKRMMKIVLDRIQQKKPKFTMKKLQTISRSDWILTAKEAVEWGLADALVQEYE